jgi:hypothetical protein
MVARTTRNTTASIAVAAARIQNPLRPISAVPWRDLA